MKRKDLLKLISLLDDEVSDDVVNAGIDAVWIVGKKYFIVTVTWYFIGELIAMSPLELVFKDAAWIPDTGRLNEMLKDINKVKEVEPFSDPVIISRGSIVCATEIARVTTEVK